MTRLLSFWPILIIFLISRLIPYVNNYVPTGYDGGIYLYIFKQFPNLPAWLKIDLFPGLFAVVYPLIKMGIDPAQTLIPLAVLSQVALFVSVYWIMQKIADKKTALLTVFILAVSSIQFRAYWYFYLKNIYALVLLLPALYFAVKKSFMKSLFFGVLVGFFHLEVFLVYALIISIQILFSRGSRMFNAILLIFVLGVCGLYYFPFIKHSLLGFLTAFYQSSIPARVLGGATETYGGAFYGLGTSFLLVLLYLPLGFYGMYHSFIEKNKLIYPFIVGFIITFLMVITKFFFYQRMFIIFDVFLIIFAGVGLGKIKNREMQKYSLGALLIFFTVFVLKTKDPLISQMQLGQIQQFGKDKTQGYVLATGIEDPAWLMGYTNLPVISWGYGDNDKYWKTKDWKAFYSSSNQKDLIGLLDLLPKPLYIFVSEKTKLSLQFVLGLPCLKQEEDFFYKYQCNK